MVLSTLLAALPIVVLLGTLGILEMRAHLAAALGLLAALLVAIFVFGMPAGSAVMAAVDGAGYGLFPIGWIVLNVIFLYQLTKETGRFEVLQHSIAGHHQRPPAAAAAHRLLLRRVLRGRGRLRHAGGGHGRDPDRARLLAARGLGLSLIANTAPVAFGALGTPIIAPAAGHRARPADAQRDGRPAAAVLLVDRAVLADLGLRRLPRMLEVWPAILVAGLASRCRSFSCRTFTDPGWSTSSRRCSMACLARLPAVWQPRIADDRGAGGLVDRHRGRGGGWTSTRRSWRTTWWRAPGCRGSFSASSSSSGARRR